MVVKWMSDALSEFNQMARWYRNNISRQSASSFRKTIIKAVGCIEIQPLSGKVDEDFSTLGCEFRSLVAKQHKVIYVIKNQTIWISAIWDCRRDETEIKG